jgi:branched-chain amino acid transport system substrate-binding protein
MKLLNLFFSAILISLLPGSVLMGQQIINNPKEQDKTIKIGLLIPDKNSLAAQHGAEMAILEANKKGGLKGKPYQLVVRSMEGTWGTGSKRAVDLLFEDKVWAIMGSHDGRNAHLVEQACTKVRAVFLSTWAGDPTLSKAFVPWYFSCVPNDLQRADALISEIYNKEKLKKIAAVSDDGYDSKLAMECFLKKNKTAGKPDPVQFLYSDSSQDFKVLIDNIDKAHVDAIILFSKPSASVKIIRMIHQKKMNQAVFGSLSLLDENELSNQEMNYYEGTELVSSVTWGESRSQSFSKEFMKTYGKLPGAVAAYAYDGMSLLIEAIKTGGLDRVEIQKAMIKTRFEGITGLIRFDDKGNRIGNADLVKIKNGIPVRIERN